MTYITYCLVASSLEFNEVKEPAAETMGTENASPSRVDNLSNVRSISTRLISSANKITQDLLVLDRCGIQSNQMHIPVGCRVEITLYLKARCISQGSQVKQNE